MDKRVIVAAGLLLLGVIIYFSGIFSTPDPLKDRMPGPGKAREILTGHRNIFEKRIEEVTDGVHVAIGYALANVIVIETGEGNIIIDTTESVDAAAEIKKDLGKIGAAPTRAIIYTHAHADHVYGSPVFAEKRAAGFEVYAHKSHYDFFSEQVILRDILNLRGIRQFGSGLPEEMVITHGCGPVLRFNHHEVTAYVKPTILFDDDLHLEIGGKKLLLRHAPGETEDQIIIWMPEERVLFPGDNYYPALPNLYTIRGSAPRDIADWFSSLDMMRELPAEYMVPGHAGPVTGAERIYELLTVYRDAIQYIHDSVIRGANKGKTRDQLVAEIKLPPHLREYPELRELYGKISFSVRSIYDRYLGWFDGNAVNLDPLPEWERAEKITAMAGGTARMIEEAEKALENGEAQWAAELSQMVLHVEPDSEKALEINIRALLHLGEHSINTNARNYYFSQAYELSGAIKPGRFKISPEAARAVPMKDLFRAMTVQLNPEAAADEEITAVFNITDTGEVYSVIVRRGVAELRFKKAPGADLVVNVEENTWKELAAGTISPAAALAGGKLQVEGGRILRLRRFSALFGGP